MPSTTATMKRTQIYIRVTERDEDTYKARLVGVGVALRGEQVGQPGMARGLNGGWRRSVVQSRAAGGRSGGNRATLASAINTSPPRLVFTTTYLSRVTREKERAKLDSLPTSRTRGWNRRAGELRSPWTWTGPSFNLPSLLQESPTSRRKKIRCRERYRNSIEAHLACLDLSRY